MKRTWRILVPVLMIVLLMVTAVGVVCHHRDSANSAANCTLCHMAINPALVGAAQGGLVLQSSAVIVPPETLLSRLSVTQVSPRAPPV